jgi:surface carbohydrate biosynthesis protein
MFFKIYKILERSIINFSTPSNVEILILDDESSKPIEEVVSNYKYFILQARAYNIDTLFINLKIIFFSIYFFRGNFFSSYLISLIKIIKPKIVITHIDNSLKFSEIALRFKRIDKNIKFIAVQNGARYAILENHYLFKKKKIKENINKKLYIPIFLSFGNYEKYIYKKLNIKVNKIISVGSLSIESYKKFKKKDKIKIKKKKQICLLSDHAAWDPEMSKFDSNLEKNFILLTEFCLKFSNKYNYKLVICQKRNKPGFRLNPEDKTDHQYEQMGYKKYLNHKYFVQFKKKLLKRRSETSLIAKNKFNTYKIMEESEVLISSMSLMLRENLLLRNKILAANLTGHSVYNFPLKKFFSFNNHKYAEFEKKLLFILKMSKAEYFKKAGKNVDYCISNNLSPTKHIRSVIAKYI